MRRLVRGGGNMRTIPGGRDGTWRRGTAIVEFAVVLPLLLVLLFGIIDFGWVFMIRQTLTNAAREGCRIAVLKTASDADVLVRVRSVMEPTGYVEDVDWFVTTSPITDEVQWVKITMPVDRASLTGGFILHGGYDLSGSSSMRKEGFVAPAGA